MRQARTRMPLPSVPASGRARELMGGVGAWGGRLNLPLGLIVGVGFAFAAPYAVRVKGWVVMPDEMQYERLSLSIGQRTSLVPHIHDTYVANFGQVYPILTAPFFHFFELTKAWELVHLENALIMASAAIPAYLLTVELTESR